MGGLDARRDAALARVLVRLQARARGLLARRKAVRLRTQHTAARYHHHHHSARSGHVASSKGPHLLPVHPQYFCLAKIFEHF